MTRLLHPTTELRRLEAQLKSRMQEFDLLALLRLLRAEGFDASCIRFQSHDSLTSQTMLIHDIRLEETGAVIALNLGLLSAQSPLPGYFRQIMDQNAINTSSFKTFLRFFDHVCIVDYLANIYPEINATFFADWEATKRHYVALQNPRSVSTLSWLFRLVFPELQVQAEPQVFSCDFKAMPIRLGALALGGSVAFGATGKMPVLGSHITLVCDLEGAELYASWPMEVHKRLESLIFPVLSGREVFLEIVLQTHPTRWLRLHRQTQLGYDPLRGETREPQRLCMFRGYVRGHQSRETSVHHRVGIPCRLQV